MRNVSKRGLLRIGFGVCALALIGGAAAAASATIERAKNQCIVGEQADGYLGFVPGKNADQALRREVRGRQPAA